MDRKELIKKYLNADTSCNEEQALAESFTRIPPADEEERAVCRVLQSVTPVRTAELPEATEEFDRLVRPSRIRTFFTWGLPLAGVAAALAAILLFTGRPEVPSLPATPDSGLEELLRQLAVLPSFHPDDADRYEFKPVGDGFIMTAHFPDGQTASYILTPLEGGESLHLISLNK